MTDSDFDDDDDEAVLQLMRATQRPQISTPLSSIPPSSAPLAELFRAHGEIAILRAQLESLQKLKAEEAARLNSELGLSRETAKDRIDALKQSVDKLEDEKRFLRNEVNSLSATKRRKIPSSASNGTQHVSVAVSATLVPASTSKVIHEPNIQIQDDWLQLCHHLWHYTINGCDRASLDVLSRICVPVTIELNTNFVITSDAPILSQIWDYFLHLNHLRLDGAVLSFCELVLALVELLLARYHDGQSDLLVSVPYLLSLLFATVNFKPLAVTEPLVKNLIAKISRCVGRFTFVLQLNDEEEEALLNHENVTYQQRLLENFTLIVGLDLLECLAGISTQFGPEFVRSIWTQRLFDQDLLHSILPENTERFVATVQINVIFNAVEIFFSSLTENGFSTGDEESNLTLVRSLIKAFLMDIEVKEDFLFYGLNRFIGNNNDFSVFSGITPEKLPSFLNVSFTSVPCPVQAAKRTEKENFVIALNHDCHILSLRIRIATLLESVIACGMGHLVNLPENIKLIVRVIGFEQNLIIHQPRYQYIYMRLQIIGTLVRMLFYIIDEHKSINTLIYPETLYEILVVLMRIAFGSDSLAVDAHKLLSEIRARGALHLTVFNQACELRSRELAHLSIYDTAAVANGELADAEANFANGLEFPYDAETIEIAREMLGVCLNHDEADNLYYNMTSQRLSN